MAATNFKTENNTFRKLIGNGLTYRIPRFQRDYSWTNEEWEDLWSDILGMLESDGETAHYMGYLVLQSADDRSFDDIDGQQRLTTISLIVIAVLKNLQRLIDNGNDPEANKQRADQIRQTYVGYLDPVTLVARPNSSDLLIKAKQKKTIILAGAYINYSNNKNRKRYDSAIISFGYKNRTVYITRQPIPLSGWIPFSSHGLNAHLFSKGVGMIDHRKVLFLVCFEELLPGIISSSFFSDNTPHVIISVVNNIVGKGTGERRSQYNSIYLMSRLFNASLLRSWNR